MKILAMEKELPGISAERFQPYLKDEARRVWELYRAGAIRELYFRADRHEAVFVLECEDESEGQRILSALPLVQAGLIIFEVIPLAPYPGFSRLFGADNLDAGLATR